MKKYILIVMILISYNVVFSENLNDAKRYLKLANSFINAEDFDNANINYNKAQEIVAKDKSWEGRYWDAVCDETLGYFYLKLNNVPLAKLSFETALKKYKKLIKLKDNSPEAVNEIIRKISDLESNSTVWNSDAKIINFDNTKKAAENLILPESVQAFSCVNCKLKEIPNSVFSARNINSIVLSNNRIKNFTVPKSNSINYLDLSNNKIKSINGDFKDLPNLSYLNLSNNSLKNIPVSLTELKSLKILNLIGNKIPFSEIKTLTQALPNTLILNDNYILEPENNAQDEEIIEGE